MLKIVKNDIILIDSIISQRIKDRIPSENNGEVFEFMAYEQILKEYDLNKDEIRGMVQMTCDTHVKGGMDHAIETGHVEQKAPQAPPDP